MNETKHTEWEKNGHFFQIMMITIIARSYNMTYSLFLVFMFTAATTTEKKIEIEIQLMEKNSLKHEKWKKSEIANLNDISWNKKQEIISE